MVVVRPSYDQAGGNRTGIDSRTTLAVLDPDRATWVMDCRLDDRQGLELAGRLQQIVELEALSAPSSGDDEPIRVTLLVQPEDGQSSRVLDGGQWRVRQVQTPTNARQHALVTLAIEDRQGQPAGEAVMNLLTARDLLLRLGAAVRAPRP